MYAAESNAPEGPGAQAPDLRGGCVYGHGPRRCGAGRSARPTSPKRPKPPIRPRSAALELSASCVRAGFPHPGRRGRV